MLYVDSNPKTKKALKDAVAAGRQLGVFQPGLGPNPTDGEHSVGGPHYPAPHSWYARVIVKGGVIVKVVR